jgi:hypothetical protein
MLLEKKRIARNVHLNKTEEVITLKKIQSTHAQGLSKILFHGFFPMRNA